MPNFRQRLPQKPLWVSLLVSLLIHLGGIGLVEYVWWGAQEERLVKVRLVRPFRMQPVRLEVVPVAGGQAEPLTRMERLAPETGGPRSLSEAQLPMGGEAGSAGPGGFGGQEGLPLGPGESVLALGAGGPGARGEGPFVAPGERGPILGGLVQPGGGGREVDRSFELLRLQDMARANRDHAAVIPNWASRRDLKGYVNFTRVEGEGYGSAPPEDLVRHMNDYTRLLVQVRPGYYNYFLNPQLLKDPIHFFSQRERIPAPPYTRMSEAELELLSQYLRGGGFLCISGHRAFLNEMVTYMKYALKGEGRLFSLPLSHPLYTAYYDFSGGFPGEDKLDKEFEQTLGHLEKGFVGGDPWYFPGGRTLKLEPDVIALAPIPLNPLQQVEQPRPGTWGVELNGQLVAVLTDLGISSMPGTNIVVYALTRQGGLTPKLPPPAWETVKPQEPLAERPAVNAVAEQEEVLDELDASLALVQTPLGRESEKVQVILDGKYSVELLKGGLHGLILHNLPPGSHWLELRYAGKRKQLEVELKGGQVRTVTFGLNRFGFLTQLRLSQQEELMGPEAWRVNFGDLQIEEVYLGEDREKLE